jgi:hypothetical protein
VYSMGRFFGAVDRTIPSIFLEVLQLGRYEYCQGRSESRFSIKSSHRIQTS